MNYSKCDICKASTEQNNVSIISNAVIINRKIIVQDACENCVNKINNLVQKFVEDNKR